MRLMPFQRPTNHYDDRVRPIDEQICALLEERKEVSNNNPGYPPLEDIAQWAQKYGMYEDFLRMLFAQLRNEEFYRPRVEPQTFRKHVPILKAVECNGEMYTITFIRQYDNASVVSLHVDADPAAQRLHPATPPRNTALQRTELSMRDPKLEHRPEPVPRHRSFELSVGEGYDCRSYGGSGSEDHFTHRFTVSPPLPDDISGLRFVFKEYTSPVGEPTGFEVPIQID